MFLIHSIQLQRTKSMLQWFMLRILSLSLSLLLISLNSHAIDLFGYKLYDNIFKYENDGDIKFKKEIIESISIQEERVLISNKYLKNYVIKATKTGNIYEIHGSNKLLQLNPKFRVRTASESFSVSGSIRSNGINT